MNQPSLPVAVIGTGPVGLAAAAHLLAQNETPLILEAGPAVGHAVRQWGHVRMFTRDILPNPQRGASPEKDGERMVDEAGRHVGPGATA